MSPRRNRPKRAPKRPAAEPRPAPDIVVAPEGWHARRVQPVNAQKQYRCPGCDQWIHPGTTHVVAWRDDREEDRRHWHTPCWRRSSR